MGIQSDSNDSANPMPGSVNEIAGDTGTLLPGSYIRNGKIRFVSNNGEDNAVSIDLTSFRIKSPTGAVTTPNVAFGSVQTARARVPWPTSSLMIRSACRFELE